MPTLRRKVSENFLGNLRRELGYGSLVLGQIGHVLEVKALDFKVQIHVVRSCAFLGHRML